MTKTLTEQWREGTLTRGAYYVNRLGEVRIYLVTYEDNKNTHEIYEVLAPVPSYEEWKRLQERNEKLEKMAFHYTPEEWNTMMRMTARLQEQLAIATKALKKLTRDCNKWELARKALKEMEGVK